VHGLGKHVEGMTPPPNGTAMPVDRLVTPGENVGNRIVGCSLIICNSSPFKSDA
jgi:hypothetical protein